MRTVGCQIKIISTGLFCEIEIGYQGGNQAWVKLRNEMSRLDPGYFGLWGDLVDNNDNYIGITVLPPNAIRSNANGSKTFKEIARLDKVPKNFLNMALCGNYLEGKGIWSLTKEPISYMFFSPCV